MRDILSRDIQHQTTVMTVRLGSMIGAGFALPGSDAAPDPRDHLG